MKVEVRSINRVLILFVSGSFFFILCSCNSENSYSSSSRIGEKKKLDIDIRTDYILADSLFEKIRVINLKSMPKGVIGRADKVIVYDSLIFLHDRHLAKGLFVFDFNGFFIRQIGKKGNGPGEYLLMEDFDIEEDVIYFIDSGNGKINRFDLNGEFLGYGPDSRETRIIPHSLYHFNDNYVFYSQYGGGSISTNFNISIVNDESMIVKKDLKNDYLSKLMIDFGKGSFRAGNEVVFTQLLNDSIYVLDGEDLDISVPYILNLDEFKLTIEEFLSMRRKYPSDFLQKLTTQKKGVGIVKTYANPDYIWVQYLTGAILKNIIINRLENEASAFIYVLQSSEDEFIIEHPVGSFENSFVFYNSTELLNEKFKMADDGGSGIIIFASR
jgi:hypothetical protein